MDLLVLAKEPVPGRVKTRLCPPCSPVQAAQLAAAALADTLAAAVGSAADRVVLGLDGSPGGWCPPGVEVVAQGDGSLGRRLEELWSHAWGPALQIGMDTPQVTSPLLDGSMAVVADAGSALGLADDGGWWALGLGRWVPGCFDGIVPSRSDTGRHQRDRLVELLGRTALLPVLRDVDHWDDALAVAAGASTTRFARQLRQLDVPELAPITTRVGAA